MATEGERASLLAFVQAHSDLDWSDASLNELREAAAGIERYRRLLDRHGPAGARIASESGGDTGVDA